MYNFKNKIAATSFALAATFMTVAAASPSRAEPAAMSVSYGDIDVSTPAGAAELDTRIHRAARNACNQDQIGTRLSNSACVKAAETAFRAELAKSAGSAALAAAR